MSDVWDEPTYKAPPTGYVHKQLPEHFWLGVFSGQDARDMRDPAVLGHRLLALRSEVPTGKLSTLYDLTHD